MLFCYGNKVEKVERVEKKLEFSYNAEHCNELGNSCYNSSFHLGVVECNLDVMIGK